MNIRTVNMVWERRLRGAYAVSRYALDDEGTLTLAVPRPLEARAYDLTRLRLDGGTEVRAGFTVETLLKLDVSAQADDCVGMTADDLYLFHAGGKIRFLGERRINFVDMSLSVDGQRVAGGFSDMAGTNFALALGDITGRVHWLRDVDAPLSTVALSRDGGRIAFGADSGMLWLVDAARRDVWAFEQGEPMRALACSEDGVFLAYGTAEGAVGLIDGDGTRQWEARLSGEVVALALSGDGAVCVAFCRPAHDDSMTHCFCLIGAGQVGWEYEAERRLVGLSVSANGRYLAASGRDGTQAVFEIVPGAAAGVPADPKVQSEALAASGDLEGAVRVLRAALDANPADVEVCLEWADKSRQWMDGEIAKAKSQFDAGDYAAAVITLETVIQAEPMAIVEVVEPLSEARFKRSVQLREEGLERIVSGDSEAAEKAWLEAIASCPANIEARQDLAKLRAYRTQEADAEADRLLAQGELEAGVAALERAQAVAPTSERAAKLNRATIAMEFAAGMAAYNEKRYSEAVFQFKKALARDPDHSEAKRYLGYAQKFAQDAATDTLGDRFSRLE
jgi:tetratricopeptide (TPR) repeat protein